MGRGLVGGARSSSISEPYVTGEVRDGREKAWEGECTSFLCEIDGSVAFLLCCGDEGGEGVEELIIVSLVYYIVDVYSYLIVT